MVCTVFLPVSGPMLFINFGNRQVLLNNFIIIWDTLYLGVGKDLGPVGRFACFNCSGGHQTVGRSSVTATGRAGELCDSHRTSWRAACRHQRLWGYHGVGDQKS